MDEKWSGDILAKVMDFAGTPAWDKWKAERKAANLPIFDGQPQTHTPSSPLPRTKKSGAAAVLP
jgi:small subunit ribosomal protein S25